MRCLSIRQPWADLIVRGVKDVENRGWQCRIRGPLLIHASLTLEKITRMELEKRGHRFGYLPLGCIVGAARIVDCLPGRLAKSDWHEEDARAIIDDYDRFVIVDFVDAKANKLAPVVARLREAIEKKEKP